MSLTMPAGIPPLADAFELVTLELARSPALIAFPTLPAAVPAPLDDVASAANVVPLRVHVWTDWLSDVGVTLASAMRDVSGIEATAVVAFSLAPSVVEAPLATPTRMERDAGLNTLPAEREPGMATRVFEAEALEA